MDELRPPISEYFAECNSHNFESLVRLFSPGATVEDEGQTHRGTDEIRAWAEKTQAEYRFTLAPLRSRRDGEMTVVAASVAGDFPGSPIELNFAFTLAGDKIAALRIGE